MEIALAEERMLRLVEAFSPDEALARVEGEKVTAFGAVARLAREGGIAIKLAKAAVSRYRKK